MRLPAWLGIGRIGSRVGKQPDSKKAWHEAEIPHWEAREDLSIVLGRQVLARERELAGSREVDKRVLKLVQDGAGAKQLGRAGKGVRPTVSVGSARGEVRGPPLSWAELSVAGGCRAGVKKAGRLDMTCYYALQSLQG